jgi:hypothetical protein
MNDNERLQLQKLIKMNDVEDQTQRIRELRHSSKLKEEIETLIKLRNEYSDDLNTLSIVSIEKCSFLFTNYTDIFNRVKKDEIDIPMLMKFIDTLSKIEDGKIDQHEGSFEVGKILKQIYIDSALKKSEKIDKIYETKETNIEPVNISWKEWCIQTNKK